MIFVIAPACNYSIFTDVPIAYTRFCRRFDSVGAHSFTRGVAGSVVRIQKNRALSIFRVYYKDTFKTLGIKLKHKRYSHPACFCSRNGELKALCLF